MPYQKCKALLPKLLTLAEVLAKFALGLSFGTTLQGVISRSIFNAR
jgi:hypothetical protein